MTNHARRSFFVSLVLLLGGASFASPALADPAASVGAGDGAASSAMAASAPDAAANAAAPTSAKKEGASAVATRPRAKTNALDGADLASSAPANEQVNKSTGSPLHMGEARLATIGDARAIGTTAAGAARRVAPVADESTAAATAPQAAHRTLGGVPGGAAKETADAVTAAMPQLIACLPQHDEAMQGGEALIKAAVARGGAVLSSTVGSFSAMPSSVASCFASALGTVSFDPARQRPALVSVHLKVGEIDKRRVQPAAAVASAP